MASPLEVVIVHSSDLHLGVDDSFSDHDRLAALPKVLTAANKVGADVVVLAGDTFDNHRNRSNFWSTLRRCCAITITPSLFCPAIMIR